ncbi:MAG: CrcB family protein [Deltaproteobacteria bacterium]
MKILYLSILGAAGTIARYWLGGYVQRLSGNVFPWGTFVVNMAGCLLFGIVWSAAGERIPMSDETRRILLIGFMGAFTTFSSFMFDTVNLMHGGEWSYAAANLILQNITGIVLIFLGIAIGRML